MACRDSVDEHGNRAISFGDDDSLRYDFFTSCPSKVVEKIAATLEVCRPRTAQPQGGPKVAVMYTSEHYPKILDDAELDVTDQPDGESKPSEHAYHLEPEQDDAHFLCDEKVPQICRGQWMQQNVMIRNGFSFSQTDDIVVALDVYK
eukprot:5211086-Pyramimonas_sp.AAC.1